MTGRVCYVIGGPLQRPVEDRKKAGLQPLSEFNVFIARNGARLASTDESRFGAPMSWTRRFALASKLAWSASPGDVFVASGEDIGLPLALATATRRDAPRVWITLHGSYLGTSKFNNVAPVLKHARHVGFLCLSESLRRQLVDDYGFPPSRCFAPGYGVDTEFFQHRPQVNENLIVSAGSSNRDYPTLVAATAGLGVPVRIAADSLWRPKAAELGGVAVPAGVEVASAGDYVGLRALYGAASVVVVPLHPSRFASGFAVIAEAMAMGRVVVATATEGRSDLIVDGETGVYTAPGDVAGLRRVLTSLLDDPARREEMGSAASARMNREFSLEAYCERMEAIVGRDRPTTDPSPYAAGKPVPRT